MEENTIVVLLYEDIAFLREGLYQLINGTPGMKCAAAFDNPSKVKDQIYLFRPDVILMDIEMPEMTGIEAVKIVRKEFPEIPVLMQTIHEEDEKIFEALCAGAAGYVLKKTKPADLLEAIETAATGGAPMSPAIATKVLNMFRKMNESGMPVQHDYDLSEKEKNILSFLVKGFSQKMIADEVEISIDTVRFHFKNIYKKLQVHSQAEAVSKAITHKIV